MSKNLMRANPGGIGLGGGGILRRFARLLRMAFLYVSELGMGSAKATAPMNTIGHCVQRQPLAWAANPPTTGPRVGPRKGVNRKVDDAAARWTGTKMSEFVPAPTARQPDPAMPARKRQMIRVAKFCAKPAARVKRRDGAKIVR